MSPEPSAVPATVEYLNTVVSEMGSFRIAATHANVVTFDDEVARSIEEFLPYRNELVELFLAIASYSPNNEMIEALHRFFERLMPFFHVPEDKGSSFNIDFDNLKFIIHELFLCCIGAFIKHERFGLAASFSDDEYYFHDRSTRETMHRYVFFREHLDSLDTRNKRLKLGRLSLRAELLKQRCTSSGLEFKYMMIADFALWLRDQQTNNWRRWWPETLIYATSRSHLPLEIFARAKSTKYFERITPLLGVRSKQHLVDLVQSIETQGDARLPRWDYESLDLRRLLQLDALATIA